MPRGQARTRASSTDRVRLLKLVGQQRYLALSRSTEPGAYFELTVGPWGGIRCSCPGFNFRRDCRHARALARRLEAEKRNGAR